MGLVSTWLNGIGLRSDVSRNFEAAGIVSPEHLADLDVTYFESLGVTNPDDRRKLFYLVQRIKIAVKDKSTDNIKRDERFPNGRYSSSTNAEEHMDAAISSNFMIKNLDKPDTKNDSEIENAEEKSKNLLKDEKKKQSPRRSKRIRTIVKKKKKIKKEDDTKENINNKIETSALHGSVKMTSVSMRNKTRDPFKIAIEEHEQECSSPVEGSSLKPEEYKEDAKDKKANHHQLSARKHPISGETVVSSNSSKSAHQSESNRDKKDSKKSTNKCKKVKKTKHKTTLHQPVKNSSFNRQSHKSKLPGSKRDNKMNSLVSLHYSESQSSETDSSLSGLLNDDAEEYRSISDDASKQKRRITLAANISTIENHFQLPINKSITEMNKNNHQDTTVNSITTDNDYSASINRRIQKKAMNRSSKSMSASDSMLLHQSQGGSLSSTITKSSKKDRNKPTFPSIPVVNQATNDIAESWATQIDDLREDNEAEHNLFRDQVEIQNQFHDYYDMRIKVVIRKRPLSQTEARLTGGVDVIHPLDYGSYGRTLVYHPKTRVDLTKEVETVPFAFDNVFDETSTNIGIYERSIRNLVEPLFTGQWATVFAYGQTGSGKTYTMMGSNITGVNAGTARNDESNLGLYYLAALDIFKMIEMPEHRSLKIHVSLFEIYGGKLFDLLNERNQIKCLEDSKGQVCFPGLTEHPVHAPDHVMQLIEEGAINRSTGTTSRNADSSRSHAILQIKLMKNSGRKKDVEHGRFSFIDLAGSERGADTANASTATRREGAEINTSLLALKEVIRALATGGSMTHIPFRGSKLTQVLKDSFVGDNSRCCMVACISPDIGNCEQTLNTLRYADRVKERNPESGVLSTSCEQQVKKTLIQTSKTSTKYPLPQSIREGEDEDSYFEQSDGYDADYLVEESRALDITRTTITSEAQSNNFSAEDGVGSTQKQKAGKALVSNHRKVMARWLAMVKNEMNSVNQVDAERDEIDKYLVELQNLQRTQLDFISELRGSLQRYVSASEDTFQTAAAQDDDDSFEDLRD